MFTTKSTIAREIPVLNNVSLVDVNAGFIHDKIFPTVQSAQRSGKITNYGDSHMRIYGSTKRTAADTNDHRVSWNFEDPEQFFIDKHDLMTMVTDEEAALFPNVADKQIDSQIVLTQMQNLAQEQAAADAVFNSSVLTKTAAASSGWNGASGKPNSDIATALEELRKNCGHKPTKVVVGAGVVADLKTNPEVLAYFNGTTKVVGDDVVMQYLKVLTGADEILVGGARKITSKEGQTVAKGDVWGDSIAFLYTPSVASLRMQSLGFRLTPTGQKERFLVFDQKYGEEYVKEWEYTDIITDINCGYLLTNLNQ